MPLTVHCQGCENQLPNISFRLIAEENGTQRVMRLCETCVAQYTPCTHCGIGERTSTHIHVNANGRFSYCASCTRQLTCGWCGVFHPRTRGDGDRFACPSCFPHHFHVCERCGSNVRASYTFEDGLCGPCLDERDNYDDEYDEEDRDPPESGDCNSPLYSSTFKKNPFKRLVGFELEFFYDVRPTLLRDYGRLHNDGSLSHPTLIPAEFSSAPSNGDKLFEIVDASTKHILKDCRGEVNNTCGFHIHLDVSDLDSTEKENIRNWWCYFERVFFAFVPENRRTRSYCKSVIQTWTKNQRHHYWKSDRYVALNITADSKWGTYEIRLHHGTLNATKIKCWISLFLSFFDVFSRIKFTTYRQTKLNKMNERELLIFFFQQLRFPLSLQKHFVMRIKQYGNAINIRKGSKPTNIPNVLTSSEVIRNAFGERESLTATPVEPIDLVDFIAGAPVVYTTPTRHSWLVVPQEIRPDEQANPANTVANELVREQLQRDRDARHRHLEGQMSPHDLFTSSEMDLRHWYDPFGERTREEEDR